MHRCRLATHLHLAEMR